MRHSSGSAKTILLVANYQSDVGYAWWLMENFWNVIATRAAANGQTCVVAYPRIAAIPSSIRDSPLEIIEFDFNCRSFSSLWRGLGLIRRFGVRSVYLTDWPYYHSAYLLWRLAGVENIVVHDHTPGDRPPVTGLRSLLKSSIHRLRVFSATNYVAVSDYIRVRLQENARIPQQRCTVVTNGIRLFDRTPEDAPRLRKELGIPENGILIVMVSRATHYKNLGFAVRCLEELLRDGTLREQVYAIHCGDGPDLDEFVGMAAGAGLGDNCRFLGRRTDVRQILCAADIAFHPSRGEAMSLAILEFMCAELAVVTSDLPSVCCALEPGVSGMTYRYDDLIDAVSVLRRLVTDAALRKALGVAARIRCQQRYGLDETNRLFVERVVPHLMNQIAPQRSK